MMINEIVNKSANSETYFALVQHQSQLNATKMEMYGDKTIEKCELWKETGCKMHNQLCILQPVSSQWKLSKNEMKKKKNQNNHETDDTSLIV